MNRRAIKITFFCMIFAGILLVLCILGMKQLQVIGSMKSDTESVGSEISQQETQGQAGILSEESGPKENDLPGETGAEDISPEDYYKLEGLNDSSRENEAWDSQMDEENGNAVLEPEKEWKIDEDDPFPYYIKVNRQANCVTIYIKDEQDEYTVPVKAMVCSVGKRGNTPLGVFKTSTKYNWRYLYGDVYGQYAYRINGPILFHSVPYYEKDKSTLETEEFNKLGQPASKGCVRLTVEDAKWLIDNCPKGTTVEIYDSEDPGPLGKPEAIKIDTNSPNKGWDPTDPDEENPWNTTEEEEQQREESNQSNESSQREESNQSDESTQGEIWEKEYAGNTEVAGEDCTPPVIQIDQENLATDISRGQYSEEQLIEQAKSRAIEMVSSNVSVEDDSFYTNVVQVESMELVYQKNADGKGNRKLLRVRVNVKISVEDTYRNQSEKTVTVPVEILDSSG